MQMSHVRLGDELGDIDVRIRVMCTCVRTFPQEEAFEKSQKYKEGKFILERYVLIE